MEKAAATTKIKIRKRVFLGEFKLEEYLQKQVALLVTNYHLSIGKDRPVKKES